MDSSEPLKAVGRETERLSSILQAVFQVPDADLNDDASPLTLPGWDSLKHIQLILALEGEYGVRLSPDDAMQMQSVGLIKAILREKGIED